jgi:uncharacterized protein (UPF0332 family)
VGRELSQLETARTNADYGEPSISVEEAKDAIARAEHVVEVIEQVLANGPPDKREE